jgi:hypothetical protein
MNPIVPHSTQTELSQCPGFLSILTPSAGFHLATFAPWRFKIPLSHDLLQKTPHRPQEAGYSA